MTEKENIKDKLIVGSVGFLSCVTCTVGCTRKDMHLNVTQFDFNGGLCKEYACTDDEGYVLQCKPEGGCILLSSDGCVLSEHTRPLSCLVCPLHIGSDGVVVVDLHCPDAARIALGIMYKDATICSYVGAAARLMRDDVEFLVRSAKFVDRYTCKLSIGHVDELAKLV